MDHNPLHKPDSLLLGDEFFPLNPSTLSLEFVDLVALTILLDCLFFEEEFPDFQTLTPFFIDLTCLMLPLFFWPSPF